jgi:hypothetical protein
MATMVTICCVQELAGDVARLPLPCDAVLTLRG